MIKKTINRLVRYHQDYIQGVDLRDCIRSSIKNNRVNRLVSPPGAVLFEPGTIPGSPYGIVSDTVIFSGEGIGLRRVLFRKPGARLPHTLWLISLVPDDYRFEVIDSHSPLRTKEWFDRYRPSFLVNGGYFNKDYTPVGLLKCKDQTPGEFNNDLSGMLCIRDHHIDIDWAKNSNNYDLQKTDYILQSGPVIIEPDFREGIYSDTRVEERRTVISKDSGGNIVFAVFPMKSLSLYGVMQFLKQFNIKVSLNLDGGTSTGFYLSVSNMNFEYYHPSIKKVPNIIAAFRR
ncbi:MAG: phosphodiester glycosidase family protein [bacterium]|nr:phosphodiester glycosidase family protein [bacterium]